MDTTKRNKNGLLLIAGALAGAAATYYLQTPAGKKLRKDISKKTNKFANDTTEKAKTLANDVRNQRNISRKIKCCIGIS